MHLSISFIYSSSFLSVTFAVTIDSYDTYGSHYDSKYIFKFDRIAAASTRSLAMILYSVAQIDRPANDALAEPRNELKETQTRKLQVSIFLNVFGIVQSTLHVTVCLTPMMMQLFWQRTIITLAVTSNTNCYNYSTIIAMQFLIQNTCCLLCTMLVCLNLENLHSGICVYDIFDTTKSVVESTKVVAVSLRAPGMK